MGFTPLRKDKSVRVQKFRQRKVLCAKDKTHRSGKAGPMRVGKKLSRKVRTRDQFAYRR
jgi:hypothetical protein